MKLPKYIIAGFVAASFLPGIPDLVAQDTGNQAGLASILDSAEHYVDSHAHDLGDSLLTLADQQIDEDAPKETKAFFHFVKAKWLLNTWQLRDAEDEFLKSI